ncbi:hypothetical protein F4823DRAFT_557970 [Ustulina deusta]|nr:hypothetical protein F4823DRAFT_557970 [Ustulina deusta]
MSLNAQVGSVSRAEDAPQQQDGQDEDNLSITSTNAEDNDSEREWEVDDVLAERPHPDIPGASQYLIKWDGFQLEDSTWEPVENLGDGLLAKWEENRAEIGAGKRDTFDLATYDAACAERTERHMRRNAKRQRLGLPLTPPFPPEYADDTPVASPADQDQFTSDDEAQEVDEVDPANIPSPKPQATSSTPAPQTATTTPTPASTTRRVAKQNTFVGIPSQAPPKESSTSSEKGSVQKPTLAPPKTAAKTSTPSSSSVTAPGPIRKGTGGTMTGYQGTAGRSSIWRPTTTKTSTQTASSITNRSVSTTAGSSAPSSTPANALKTKRLTATRTRQLPASSAPTNVFAGGKQRKKRANLADVMADPSKAPKAFTNMRLMNLAKKRGIEKGDAVGALSSIPHKFIIGNEQMNMGSRKPSIVSPTTVGSPQNHERFNSPSAPSATVSKPQVSAEPAQQGGMEEAPPPKRKKSVRFTGEDSEELASTINELFDNTVHTDDGLKSPDADNGAQAPSRTLSLATYQERGQTQTVQKLVRFGHSEAVMVGFSGIARHTATWLSAFKAEKTLHLASTCSSFHFSQQRQQLIKEKLSAGAVETGLPEHAVALKNVAEALRRASIGLHLVAREYSILVYPVKCEGWNWLDVDLMKPDEDALLRHIIFLSPVPSRAYPSEFHEEAMALNQLIYPKGGNEPELIGPLTDLDFTKMVPQDATLINKQIYMLLIPLKELQVLYGIETWLRFHQPDRPIFTVEQSNSWHLFHEAVQAGAGGTIISHAEFTLWKLEKIPDVWRMLEDQRYTFWHLDTGENKRPQYPSDLDAISVPGAFRLTRLFPYGRAFLITPSFAISEPAKLCCFLEWFKKYAANPGHMIVTCHDFARFLRNITEEKREEHNTLTWRNPGSANVNTFLQRARRSKQDIDDHFRAWKLFQEIMERFGDEETSEKIRKIHWLNEFIDSSDEQSLVNAFCRWTQLKCDRFRRFYVLGSDPSKIQAAYRYIEIPRYFDTEGSDPDIANILLQRRLVAVELQGEADKHGTEANIAWNTDGVVGGSSRVVGKWRKSICETPFRFPSPLFPTDDAHELQRWIEDHRRRTSINWSELHQKPVSWRDMNMAKQFGDGDEYRNNFDTFSSWFKAAPQFTRRRNTWYGLFYTITDTWDEYMPKRKYERHPWIAIYRPKNPQLIRNEHFSKIELFIWDAAAAERGKIGHCLLDMQCQLIDYVYDSVAEYYPGCSLSDVWYSSTSTNLEIGRNDTPLDITCKRIREMFDDGRLELPPIDKILRDRWTHIDPRLWRAGMSPMTLTAKPVEKPSELAHKRIPQTEEDRLKPQKAIWHPVHMGTGRRGTKCLNDLHEACLKARLQDPKCSHIKYQYRPTQEWWADQVEEGRGCGYIHVGVAGRIIDRILLKPK